MHQALALQPEKALTATAHRARCLRPLLARQPQPPAAAACPAPDQLRTSSAVFGHGGLGTGNSRASSRCHVAMTETMQLDDAMNPPPAEHDDGGDRSHETDFVVVGSGIGGKRISTFEVLAVHGGHSHLGSPRPVQGIPCTCGITHARCQFAFVCVYRGVHHARDTRSCRPSSPQAPTPRQQLTCSQ